MTDNDIIKALECCADTTKGCEDCPFLPFECIVDTENSLVKSALDLINRQQAEIERFTKRQKPTGASGYKIVNGKVVFFTNMLGGCRYEYENLDEVVKTLNELLQECYSKDEIAFALKCKTEDLKTAKSEAIKEFAERLTDRAELIKANAFDSKWAISQDDIDNLVAEMTESPTKIEHSSLCETETYEVKE